MLTGTHILENGDVSIMIPLAPYTKKNHQQIRYKNNKEGKRIPYVTPSAEYLQYEQDAAIFLKPLNIDCPINVKALYYMNAKRKVDLTNLHEALHDIMVKCGTLKDDNAHIIVSTDGSRVLYDKDNPRTEVLLTCADDLFGITESEVDDH